MNKKPRKVLNDIIAFILFCIGVALCVGLQYKISNQRARECVNKGGRPVMNFYEMYEKCVYEVEVWIN